MKIKATCLMLIPCPGPNETIMYILLANATWKRVRGIDEFIVGVFVQLKRINQVILYIGVCPWKVMCINSNYNNDKI